MVGVEAGSGAARVEWRGEHPGSSNCNAAGGSLRHPPRWQQSPLDELLSGQASRGQTPSRGSSARPDARRMGGVGPGAWGRRGAGNVVVEATAGCLAVILGRGVWMSCKTTWVREGSLEGRQRGFDNGGVSGA
jgi:hypothetical protein